MSAVDGHGIALLHRERVTFPRPWERLCGHDLYPWLVLVAVLDLALTAVLLELGGVEVNPVARSALAVMGIAGLASVKAVSLLIFVVSAEWIGAEQPLVGRALIAFAIASTAAVSAWSAWQIADAGPMLGFLLGSPEPWYIMYR